MQPRPAKYIYIINIYLLRRHRDVIKSAIESNSNRHHLAATKPRPLTYLSQDSCVATSTILASAKNEEVPELHNPVLFLISFLKKRCVLKCAVVAATVGR